MENLINRKIASHEEMKLLTEMEIKNYLSEINEVPPLTGSGSQGDLGRWEFKVIKIEKLFNFDDFKQAMEFVNKVADVAEKEGHHPDISIHYNKVEIMLWSHFINGLSVNDFIVAAKVDQIKIT